MIVSKYIRFTRVILWSAKYILLLILLSVVVLSLYYFEVLKFKIPWLPVSVIGTAVAFYVGFKNNQSYDRMWEARKIWGGIVNSSRTWGIQVNGYVNDLFGEKKTESEIFEIKKKLIYRHLAWIYTHRDQLLIPTNWEHYSANRKLSKESQSLRNNGLDAFEEEHYSFELGEFLGSEEYLSINGAKNKATQIINLQSEDLEKLRKDLILDDFRHIDLMQTLSSFYDLQGKNERIKKFPLPRQYANTSRYFVIIFILLLPFTLIPEILSSGPLGLYLAVPITVTVGWVYVMMELVGDYSENPFQGMSNDIPMLSLCRTIEIDLKQILKEENLPPAIKSKNNVLM
jgi:putative membrane protein